MRPTIEEGRNDNHKEMEGGYSEVVVRRGFLAHRGLRKEFDIALIKGRFKKEKEERVSSNQLKFDHTAIDRDNETSVLLVIEVQADPPSS